MCVPPDGRVPLSDAGDDTDRDGLVPAAFGLLAGALVIGHDLPYDTWWHLAAGRWMAREGAVVRQDVLSHTAAGEPWILPSWLADLAAYGVHQALGLSWLVVAYSLVSVAAVWIVARLVSGPVLVRLAVLVPAVVTVANRGHTRPEVLTLLGVAVALALLRRDRRHPGAVRWVIPAAVVWANLHAGFVLAAVLVALDLAGRLLERRGEPLRHHVTTLLGVAAGVALLNPYGPRLWAYPVETLRLRSLEVFILEWQPLTSAPTLLLMCVSVVAVTAAGVVLSRTRPPFGDLLTLVVFGALAVSALRNAALFCLVAAPVAGDAWRAVEARRADLVPAVPRWLPAATVAAAALLLAVRLPALSPGALEASIARTTPATLVAERRPAEPVFNSYTYGGWLTWVGVPTAIDGRSDLFGDERMLAYLATVRAEAGWPVHLEAQRICSLLLTEGTPLLDAAAAAGWQRAGAADGAVLLERPGC